MSQGGRWVRLGILGGLLAVVAGAWWLLGPDYSSTRRAIRQLGEGDPVRAEQAAQVLAESQSPQALAALAEAARSRHTAAAVQALAGLGRSRQAQYLPAVQAALGDTRQEVRVAAITALGTIDSPLDPAPIVALLGSRESPALRAAAARCLGTRRAVDAIPHLVRSMRDPVSEVRAAAYGAVAHMVDRDYRFDPDAPPAERERVIRMVESTIHVALRPAP